MHPQKEVFDLCPVFTKILTYYNSLLCWEHRVIFINICLNPMKAPHAFISSIKPVWSVIALEGAQVELRTLERHCVIYWSFMCSKIWTHYNLLFGVDISYSYVFTNHNKVPYALVPSIRPIGQWYLSRVHKSSDARSKALVGISPNYLKLLADYKWFLGGDTMQYL